MRRAGSARAPGSSGAGRRRARGRGRRSRGCSRPGRCGSCGGGAGGASGGTMRHEEHGPAAPRPGRSPGRRRRCRGPRGPWRRRSASTGWPASPAACGGRSRVGGDAHRRRRSGRGAFIASVPVAPVTMEIGGDLGEVQGRKCSGREDVGTARLREDGRGVEAPHGCGARLGRSTGAPRDAVALDPLTGDLDRQSAPPALGESWKRSRPPRSGRSRSRAACGAADDLCELSSSAGGPTCRSKIM